MRAARTKLLDGNATLGLAQDLAGHREDAVATYRTLKSEIEKSGPPQPTPGAHSRGLMPWLNKFINEPYTGHPDQYLSVLVPD